MSLMEDWEVLANQYNTDQATAQKFWTDYYMQEKAVYEKMLTEPVEVEKGTVAELAEKTFAATYLIRSSSQSEKEYLTDKVGKMTEYLGGTYELKGVYPAWEFKKNSAIRDMLCESYNRLFNKEALVETMHAGVECGIMAAKIDDLDCVSFGPDIIDIHTVKEKLDIASTQRTWELITDVLKQLA